MSTAEKIDPQQEQLNELRQIAENHLLWLQSEGREGRRASLAHRDLSGISLRGIYLPEASFRGAILIGTDLSGANLQGADLSEAELEHTNFRGASLDGANFSRAQAKGAYFDEASVIEANFSHVIMEGASAQASDFSGVKFRDAILSKTNFTDAKLLHANLRYSRAVECVFDIADLTRADCRDTIFDYTRFRAAVLTEANMRGASFEHVLFTDADFSNVIDLDSSYQNESIALEKRSIKEEIENLYSVKEEVSQYEELIRSQRRDLAGKRKVLQSLNEMEVEVSETLMRYMKTFRNIAVFWFVVVALFATVLISRISDIGVENLNYLEIGVVSLVLVTVLGAHVVSAALSFKLAQQFAHYVRVRHQKLEKVPESSILSDESAESTDDSDKPDDGVKVTYL